MKKYLYPVLLGLCVYGLLACTPQRVSYENYKRTAINNCEKQPTQTDYNFCVERAKMSAEAYRIDNEKG